MCAATAEKQHLLQHPELKATSGSRGSSSSPGKLRSNPAAGESSCSSRIAASLVVSHAGLLAPQLHVHTVPRYSSALTSHAAAYIPSDRCT
jgi:hypothetical protein